jgi:streptogrisin C
MNSGLVSVVQPTAPVKTDISDDNRDPWRSRQVTEYFLTGQARQRPRAWLNRSTYDDLIRQSPAQLLLVVTLVLAMGTTAAQEPDPLSPSEPLPHSQVRGSVAYLTTTYGVSEEEALRRLELQRASPALAKHLAQQFPHEYAGMWLDQDNGGVLMVGMTQPELLADAVGSFPDRAHVRAIQARWSLQQLNEIAQHLTTTLEADPDQGFNVVADEVRNTVVVWQHEDAVATQGPSKVARLQKALAEERGRVVVEQLQLPNRDQDTAPLLAPPAAPQDAMADGDFCAPVSCSQVPMRGGYRLNIQRDDGSWGGCTNGFNVEGVKNGWVYTLTAGHCVMGDNHKETDSSSHVDIPVGVEDANLARNRYPLDYAIMPYQGGWAQYWMYDPGDKNLVLSYCQGDQRPGSSCANGDYHIQGIYTYSQIQVGWVVCATGSANTSSGAPSGWSPGTRCGQIIRKEAGGLTTNICSRRGDSGGPLFSEIDSRGYGILSDGTRTNSSSCDKQEVSYYSPLSEIMYDVNDRTGGSVGFKVIDHY